MTSSDASMRRMKSDSRSKPKLIVLRRRRLNGSSDFRIQVKFRQQLSASLRLLLTVTPIKLKLKKLPPNERVAAPGERLNHLDKLPEEILIVLPC